jgi:hypothetical protein
MVDQIVKLEANRAKRNELSTGQVNRLTHAFKMVTEENKWIAFL